MVWNNGIWKHFHQSISLLPSSSQNSVVISTDERCYNGLSFFNLWNLSRRHWLIKSYRFQLCNSIIHHLYIANTSDYRSESTEIYKTLWNTKENIKKVQCINAVLIISVRWALSLMTFLWGSNDASHRYQNSLSFHRTISIRFYISLRRKIHSIAAHSPLETSVWFSTSRWEESLLNCLGTWIAKDPMLCPNI